MDMCFSFGCFLPSPPTPLPQAGEGSFFVQADGSGACRQSMGFCCCSSLFARESPSPACGRGAGVRAFIRRMNLTQVGQTGVFCPPPSLRDTSSRRREEGLVVRVFVLGYSQAGEMLGSRAAAKREKCWVPGLSPSGTNTGFSGCRQAGEMLDSRTAVKRDKCWVPGLPPSGTDTGFSDCCQAGQMLGSRTTAKRGKRCLFIARQAALFRCFLFLSCRF